MSPVHLADHSGEHRPIADPGIEKPYCRLRRVDGLQFT
jgi:hypothetical protein